MWTRWCSFFVEFPVIGDHLALNIGTLGLQMQRMLLH